MKKTSQAKSFSVECEGCGIQLDSFSVNVSMGKKEAYSFKCEECSPRGKDKENTIHGLAESRSRWKRYENGWEYEGGGFRIEMGYYM